MPTLTVQMDANIHSADGLWMPTRTVQKDDGCQLNRYVLKHVQDKEGECLLDLNTIVFCVC